MTSTVTYGDLESKALLGQRHRQQGLETEIVEKVQHGRLNAIVLKMNLTETQLKNCDSQSSDSH